MPLTGCVIIPGNENHKNDTPTIILWQTQWQVSESDVVTSITVIDSDNSVVCEYSTGISMVMTVRMCQCEQGSMCGVRLGSWWTRRVRKIENIDQLASHQYQASLPVPWSPDHLSVSSIQSEADIRDMDQSEPRWWQHIVPVTV